MKAALMLFCVALSGCDVASREEQARTSGWFAITQYTAVAGMPTRFTTDEISYGSGMIHFTDKASGRQYTLLGTVEVVRLRDH